MTTANGATGTGNGTGLQPPAVRRGPLSGRRIIDFTWAWAGPYGAMLLALLGAEVIKVESATRIDHSRQRSLAMGSFAGGLNQAPMFNELNLNKLSIQLNLKTPGAKQVIRDLAATSDGAIDNFRPGTLDKLELGYDNLRQSRDDIVLVSASALGGVGPGAQLHGLRAHLRRAGWVGVSVGRTGGAAADDGRFDRPARGHGGGAGDGGGHLLPRTDRSGAVHRRIVARSDCNAHG